MVRLLKGESGKGFSASISFFFVNEHGKQITLSQLRFLWEVCSWKGLRVTVVAIHKQSLLRASNFSMALGYKAVFEVSENNEVDIPLNRR